MSSSSVLMVTLYLSPACVNGEPDFNNSKMVQYTNFYEASCSCTTGWEGKYQDIRCFYINYDTISDA